MEKGNYVIILQRENFLKPKIHSLCSLHFSGVREYTENIMRKLHNMFSMSEY